jgi:hypothetical protein
LSFVESYFFLIGSLSLLRHEGRQQSLAEKSSRRLEGWISKFSNTIEQEGKVAKQFTLSSYSPMLIPMQNH